MHLIKRHDLDALRGHAPKGRKVIIACDRVILDYQFRQKAKDTAGLYFVLLKSCRQKVFDEFKNKLNEKKSWASSVAAKAAQANFMCLVHNLIVLYDHELEKEGIRLSSREFPDEHYRRSENILGEAREGPWPAASGRPLETW